MTNADTTPHDIVFVGEAEVGWLKLVANQLGDT